MRRACVVVALAVLLGAAACSWLGAPKADIESAKRFDSFPLYWVGERFEQWDLVAIDGLQGPQEFVTFVYGTCKATGGEQPSCAPPLEIQVSRLCSHLDVVARAPIWRERNLRGAPVGTIDSAPVLFSSGAQVKLYRGEGSDPGLPLRALHALRSVNRVAPVIGETDPIPAPATEVLAGTRPCA